MTKQEIKEKIAYNRGKIEGYEPLYAHTGDSRHKKFLEKAKEKLKDLEAQLLLLNQETGNVIMGSIEFSIIIDPEGKDFNVSHEIVLAPTIEEKYEQFPVFISCGNILMAACSSAVANFSHIFQEDPTDEQAIKIHNSLLAFKNLLMLWGKEWGGTMLALHNESHAPKPSGIILKHDIN